MKWTTKTISIMALMIAAEIVLSRFLSIPTPYTKISLAFLPVALTGLLLGPLAAGIVGALADFLGAILFPFGPYFPGYTLTALLMGLCYGLFLYKEQKTWRILAAVGVHQLILSMLLNTLWIAVTNGAPYWPMVWTRVPQTLILTAVQLVTLPGLTVLARRIRKEIL